MPVVMPSCNHQKCHQALPNVPLPLSTTDLHITGSKNIIGVQYMLSELNGKKRRDWKRGWPRNEWAKKRLNPSVFSTKEP